MPHLSIYKFILVLFFSLVSVACSDESTDKISAKDDGNSDVVTRVGDQVITYSQLSSMLQSPAMVGLSVPAPGTPEHKQLMLTLLDRTISDNLLYLDAKKGGTEQRAAYVEDIKRFEDAALAWMYKSQVMIGEIPVSEVDVIHYYNTQTSKEAELTDDLKLTIADTIRQQKLAELNSSLRQRLRKNIEVIIYQDILRADHDDKRKDADTVASYDKQPISWGQVKQLMQEAGRQSSQAGVYIDNDEDRLARLEQYIDNLIMTQKGREFGLEKDTAYINHIADYKKARLINERRKTLLQSWLPSPEELKNYYVDNIKSIVLAESRKLQMVVLKTKEEAESIKAQIDKGEITMFQAAKQYSIDAEAKHTLGDLGWVKQGADFSDLDEFIFKLEPGIVSAPVESPAGWQLFKVLEVKAAQFADFDDKQTQIRTLRAYMQAKFNDYLQALRNRQFEVVVYDDVLERQLQKEADDIAESKRKAEQKAAITEQPDEKSHQWMVNPQAE